jgi:hypothetical protein
MTISGLKYRSLVRNNAFSAEFDLSFSNVTGIAQIGFSGQNKTYRFSFISGKVLDDQGRYFYSYSPNQVISLTTNFSGAAYDYAVNNQIVTYSGSKQNFYVDNFYADATGVNMEASIAINTDKPSLTLYYPDSFITGQFLTGYLVTNSLSGVKLFTGSFDSLSSFSFESLPTGYITSASSGQVLIKQKDPFVGKFVSAFDLNTNAGDYSQDITVTAAEEPFLNYVFNFNSTAPDPSASNDWTSTLSSQGIETGISKTAEVEFIYSYATNYTNLEPASLPLAISLSYVSGLTGYYGLVSSVSVPSGGNGYLSSPTVIFSGGGAPIAASGQAILGDTRSNFDQVNSILLSYNGSGYTSAPQIVFSGGTGIINNAYPSIASGNVDIVQYTKSFTGCFNLYTGINGSYQEYRSQNYTSPSGYARSTSFVYFDAPINIKVEYKTTFDENPLVAKLSISGIAGNLVETLITGVK